VPTSCFRDEWLFIIRAGASTAHSVRPRQLTRESLGGVLGLAASRLTSHATQSKRSFWVRAFRRDGTEEVRGPTALHRSRPAFYCRLYLSAVRVGTDPSVSLNNGAPEWGLVLTAAWRPVNGSSRSLTAQHCNCVRSHLHHLPVHSSATASPPVGSCRQSNSASAGAAAAGLDRDAAIATNEYPFASVFWIAFPREQGSFLDWYVPSSQMSCASAWKKPRRSSAKRPRSSSA
jgi:hypothetical protein